jgi:hypothetical protein
MIKNLDKIPFSEKPAEHRKKAIFWGLPHDSTLKLDHLIKNVASSFGFGLKMRFMSQNCPYWHALFFKKNGFTLSFYHCLMMIKLTLT